MLRTWSPVPTAEACSWGWEDHQSSCPAISTEHACGQCEPAMDDFAERML
jgi:hypothetical protein